MSIDIASTMIDRTSDVAMSAERPASLDVKASYDGSNIVYRLLRMESWGPALMNLGYYRFSGLLSCFNLFANMEFAQQRLVKKAMGLASIEAGQRILDIACGRGKSSFILSCANPQSKVIGIDLLDHNIQVAETLFGECPNLTYMPGNAMSLDFPDASFDRVLCLEAAFHFPDRAQFLREANRVLRPGGRLVVVDFAWTDDSEKSHCNDPETRLVREIWQYDDMFSISDYLHEGHRAGFRTLSHVDWSRKVTHPIQAMFAFVSNMGNSSLGRRLLEMKNPLYRSISVEDWKAAASAVRAHLHVQRHSKYMAFVFEKN